MLDTVQAQGLYLSKVSKLPNTQEVKYSIMLVELQIAKQQECRYTSFLLLPWITLFYMKWPTVPLLTDRLCGKLVVYLPDQHCLLILKQEMTR